MKNNKGREGRLINFLPLKGGGDLLEGGGFFERRDFIEDLLYQSCINVDYKMPSPPCLGVTNPTGPRVIASLELMSVLLKLK